MSTRSFLKIGVCALALLLSIAATRRDLLAVPTASDQLKKATASGQSHFLEESEKLTAVQNFVRLVQIKGPSRQEKEIHAHLLKELSKFGAVELPPKGGHGSPLNLVMEIPATGSFSNKAGILLNAHMDTIEQSNPEKMSFDAEKGDFFHLDEKTRGASSSYGADDRAGVAVIVEAMKVLNEKFWSKGIPHRRIVLVFTAEEEIGLKGAKYLAAHHPAIFENIDITLSIDGPLELSSKYPGDSFVLVVAKSGEKIEPYAKALKLARQFCDRTNKRVGTTEVGLGQGDFAAFPAEAKAGLHLRSPIRGWHRQERVKIQDLLNHIDLLCYLALGWDHRISPPQGGKFWVEPEALQD
jgi:putative aminopeptidase FrvX